MFDVAGFGSCNPAVHAIENLEFHGFGGGSNLGDGILSRDTLYASPLSDRRSPGFELWLYEQYGASSRSE